MKGLIVYYISLSIFGHEVTQIGPFDGASSCNAMLREVSADIVNGFENQTPYGVIVEGDFGMAIARVSDYELSCESKFITFSDN